MDTKRTMIMALVVLALAGCFAFAAVQETDAAVAFADSDIKGQDDTANDKMSVTYFEKDTNYAIQVEATGVGSLPVKIQLTESVSTWESDAGTGHWSTPVVTNYTSSTAVAFDEKAVLFTGQLKSTVDPENPSAGDKKYTYVVSILKKDGQAITGYSADLLVGQYVVVYNANGGTGASDVIKETVKYTVAPTQTAVDFKKDYHNKANASEFTWLDAPEGNVKDISSALNKNTVVYAKWTMDTYKVTFDSNKGSASTDPTGNMPPQTDIVYGTPTALTTCGFTLPGYTFKGWDSNDDGVVDYEDGDEVSGFNDSAATPNKAAQDATLKAVWQAKTYTIVFNSNAPAGTQSVATGSTAEKVITFDADASALTTNGFALTGYGFLGWTLEAQTEAKESLPTGGYADEADVQIKVDELEAYIDVEIINFYAVWKANTYTITFDLNMPTGALPYQTTASSGAYYVPLPADIESVKYDANQALANFEWETKTGIWSFAGWCLQADGHAAVYDDQATVKNLATGGIGDLTATLYALWTATALFELEVKDVTEGGPVATITGANEMSNTGTVVLLSTTDANKKFTGFTVSGGAAVITTSNLIYFDGTHGTDAYLIITPASTEFTAGVSITFTVAADPAVGEIENFYVSKFGSDVTSDQAQIHIDASTGGIPAGKLSVSGVWYTDVTVNSNSVTGYGNIDTSATGVNKDAKYFDAGATPGEGTAAQNFPIAAHTASLDKVFDLDGNTTTQTYNLYSIKFVYTSDDDTPVTASTIWAVIA